MTLQQDIANIAIDWELVPFKHQGRVRAGIDCIGLIVEICKSLELQSNDGSLLAEHDMQGYSREPAKGLLESYLQRLLVPVSGDWYLGDVLLFTFEQWPQHCGVVTRCNDDWMIFTHASQPAGKVIASRMDARWKSQLVGHYRFSDVY